MQATWLDRSIGYFAPRAQLQRMKARAATELLLRHYEGAATTRRTQGWRRGIGDANTVTGPAGARLRAVARDLVRNNPYGESALGTITDHVVGWGIVPHIRRVGAMRAWEQWANSTRVDVEGRLDFTGVQQQVMRTIVESGEVLIRRRLVDQSLQLQIMEPDFIDTDRTSIGFQRVGEIGNRIINGIEIDALGRRVAYWLFSQHPGAEVSSGLSAERVPAEEIVHVFRQDRPGQLRGASWFAPVLLRFKDLDDFEDATLMKQKIAACLSVLTTDLDGSGAPLGDADDSDPNNPIDRLEPGMILNVPPGRSVEVVQPPTVREYEPYTKNVLRSIAAGLGVTYEDLTGNYDGLPFSAARMSRLRHWARVETWRWRMLVPQFLDPVFGWWMQASLINGSIGREVAVRWTPPPMPMIEPDKEGLAIQRNIRSGIMTLSEAIRERGFDPETFLREMAADNALLDRLGIVLDSDARKMTQAGQAQPPAPQEQEPMTATEGQQLASLLRGALSRLEQAA